MILHCFILRLNTTFFNFLLFYNQGKSIQVREKNKNWKKRKAPPLQPLPPIKPPPPTDENHGKLWYEKIVENMKKKNIVWEKIFFPFLRFWSKLIFFFVTFLCCLLSLLNRVVWIMQSWLSLIIFFFVLLLFFFFFLYLVVV